ncbi:hypothetical protein GCM10009414_21340 [Tatumella terrea]
MPDRPYLDKQGRKQFLQRSVYRRSLLDKRYAVPDYKQITELTDAEFAYKRCTQILETHILS